MDLYRLFSQKYRIFILLFFILFFGYQSLEAATPLTQFLAYVVSHNATIEAQRMTVQITQQEINAQQGIFDPSLQAKTTTQKDNSSSNSLTGQAGITQKLNTGTSISLTAQTLQQTLSSTNYTSSLGINVTHPLLKNGGDSIVRYSILTAQIEFKKSKFTLFQTIQSTALSAIDQLSLYYQALKRESVAKQQLDQSQYLVSETLKRERLQTADPIDILSAKQNLSTAIDSILTAQYDAKRYLRDVLLAMGAPTPPADILTHQVLVSANELLLSELPTLSTHNLSLKTPQLTIAELEVKKAKLALQYAQNQNLPELNLLGTYGYTQTNAGWGGSWGFNSPTYSLGLNVAFPLGNTQSNAQVQKAFQTLQIQEMAFKTIQQTLSNQLQQAREDMSLKKLRIYNKKDLIDLSKQQVALEIKKFNLGFETVDKVLDAEQKLSDSELQYFQSVLDYCKAVYTVYFLTGGQL